ncbi:spore coat protein [Paenibacillus septentrionalis]|uniref:Spore coat protein n=1 Tax=Paenibacillus septentrionalis TaxID=429342 RepID=A0ABW1UZN8_9BACL
MSICHLSGLVGKLVRVNRGGPESSEGLVLVAKGDYIVVYVKHEGVVYYNLEHIKSITLLKKPFKHLNKHGHHREILWKHNKPHSFLEALRSKKNRLIKINRGGPDSITGVLTSVHRDHIKLIDKEEPVIIFTHHIKSFTPSLRLVNQLRTVQKAEKNDKK